MSDPFIGEIKIFAGNFAPRGWANCDGQLLPINQNTALFSIIGTIYGGDGRSTMGLPNLQGRAPMHPGNGPGLSTRRLGERGGTDRVTLTEQQIPSHKHEIQGSDAVADSDIATGEGLANAGPYKMYGELRDTEKLASSALGNTGGNRDHNNVQPMLGLTFIIALVGLFPSRS